MVKLTSARKEKAERSSEIGAAMAMNLLFLISLSKETLSLSVVNAPPEEEAVTIDSPLTWVKVLGRKVVKMKKGLRVRLRRGIGKEVSGSGMCCCFCAANFLGLVRREDE